MTLSPYQLMVRRKAAPAKTVTIAEFHLFHASLGLATEILEYEVATDQENVKEELGDILWYLTLFQNTLLVPDESLTSASFPGDSPHLTFIKQSERFLSLVKKETIYGTPQNLYNAFLDLYGSFHNLVTGFHYTIEDIKTSNTNKLEQRYTDEFTPEESLVRKDKEDGQ